MDTARTLRALHGRRSQAVDTPIQSGPLRGGATRPRLRRGPRASDSEDSPVDKSIRVFAGQTACRVILNGTAPVGDGGAIHRGRDRTRPDRSGQSVRRVRLRDAPSAPLLRVELGPDPHAVDHRAASTALDPVHRRPVDDDGVGRDLSAADRLERADHGRRGAVALPTAWK